MEASDENQLINYRNRRWNFRN